MFNLFKQPKFPVVLFVTASLAVLILLPVFFIYFKSLVINNNENKVAQSNNSQVIDLYDTSDPFITKVPSWKDIIKEPITDGFDPSLGPVNALITIVEFSDYKCSFCEKQEKVLKQIIDEYENKIRLIWKDYPINNINAPSYQAGIAARCAQVQNNFWPYHDLLFEESHNLNKQTFMEIAQELNLNLNQFEECLENNEIKSLINDNIIEANALDINGVPFIYVNKQEIMGEVSLEELKKIIEMELQ